MSDLPRAAPGEKGVDASRVLGFLDAVAEAGIELHSFLLVRDGKVVIEGFWRPYAADRVHMQHSATKSWTAAAVGLAIDDGRLSLDDKVASFFPEHLPPQPSANLLAMTVRDLLTMRTGHRSGISGGEWRGRRTSWVRAFLAEKVPTPPGREFIYSSGSSYMLSAIVTRVTGETARDLLAHRVFAPLGMGRIDWDVSPEGISTGGNGLTCRGEDVAKFGLLHLRRGLWRGERVLPEWWVREATHPHVAEARLGAMDGRRYAAPSGGDGKKHHGYGYHWWMTPFGGYRASGIFGQHCIVLPDHDAVIVFTSGLRPGDSRLLDLTWAHLVPALGAPHSGGDAALTARLASLALPEADGAAFVFAESGTYDVTPNEMGVTKIGFDFGRERCVFTLHDARGTHRIEAGLAHGIEGDTSMTGNALHHEYQPETMRVLARGVWETESRFVMTWRFIETAFCDTVACAFAENAVTLRRSVNTNAGALELPALVGMRVAV
jgi:CubicO group peptidase (beta-lactamase class C family)